MSEQQSVRGAQGGAEGLSAVTEGEDTGERVRARRRAFIERHENCPMCNLSQPYPEENA